MKRATIIWASVCPTKDRDQKNSQVGRIRLLNLVTKKLSPFRIMDLSCKIDVSFYRPETKPYLRAQKMFQDVELWSLENRLRHQSKIMPGNVSSLAMRFLSLFRGGQSFSYLYPYLPIKNWNISVLSRKTERRLICLLIDSLLLKTGHLLATSTHHNRRQVCSIVV